MPFRHVPAGQFNLDTMKLMQGAFDVVCQKLSLPPEDTRRSKLASIIIELAASGEREGLAEKAEAALTKPSDRRPSLLSLGRKHAP